MKGLVFLGSHYLRISLEVDGPRAVRLWLGYVNDYDEDALSMVLEYNKEDMVNIRTLKEKLL